MTDHDSDLLGAYWTISGPVVVHYGREWSLFSFDERCAHARRVGFAGVGIWAADLAHMLETQTLADLRATMERHGIELLELEFLMHWFCDPGTPERTEADAARELLFDAAASLGAHHVKVGNIPGTPCERDVLAERFAELCDYAADLHDAKIVYEVMPFDDNVPDLDTALDVVAPAGPNGGLAIDTWHMSKLGIPPDAVAALPAERLHWVELSDGRAESMEDPVDETINHRELPGEGSYDIHGYVDACRRAGYRGPWGVEVLSEALRNRPIEQIFDRAYATTFAHVRPTTTA
jgi:sugar phosphate isomerase/epimerase